MKRFLVLLFGFCLLVSAPTMADDAEDADIAFLKKAMEENINAWKSGDVDVITMHDHPEYSVFPSGGGLLREGGSDKERIRRRLETGLKYNLEHRHLQVKVFGNTGVVTCYVVGTVTYPGSEESTPVAARWTSVWAKVNGEWKWVHDHESPIKFD